MQQVEHVHFDDYVKGDLVELVVVVLIESGVFPAVYVTNLVYYSSVNFQKSSTYNRTFIFN